MVGLLDFLNARVDEDEASARAAGEIDPGPWSLADNRFVSPWPGTDDIEAELFNAKGERVISYNGSDVGVSERTALHIVRHDPARVLRQCAWVREILDAYHVAIAAQESRDQHAYSAFTAGQDAGGMLWLDWSLSQATAIWSSHPDYNPAWSAE